MYGPVVKAVEAMLKKGDRVLVEGRIATRGFTDREGQDRAVTEIVVSRRQDTVNILGGRRPDPDPSAPAQGAADTAADRANAGDGGELEEAA